jgi:hypothetical protein
MGARIPRSHSPTQTGRAPPPVLDPSPVERELLTYLAENGGVATLDAIAQERADVRAATATNDYRGDPVAMELADLSRRYLPALVAAGAIRVVDDGPRTVELRHLDERPHVADR